VPLAAPIPPRALPVQTAIARAAAATGVDFTYLLAQARLESGLDPQARARTSSARGLYQFTGSTWLNTLERHGADLGLYGGSAHDPATRARLLALRQDPQASALMAGELAQDNRSYLTGALGRDPDNAELYLAHFLGPDAAGQFLAALASDPGQSAAALLPRAAEANRAIFFDAGAPRSVGAVMDLLRARFDAAVGAGLPDTGIAPPLAAGTGPAVAAPTGGPIAREFAATAADRASMAGQSSMADTLQAAFSLSDAAGDGTDAAPAHVRAAYGRLRALGF
jgi:hypothetical protein